MIYVFKACCQAPCQACDQVCSGCSKCCDDVCKGCGKYFEPCTQILDRPLGGYVLIAGACTIPAAVFAVIALTDETLRACEHPLAILCVANVVLGLIHTGFAFYLQRRLFFGMQSQSFTAGGAQSQSQSQTLTGQPGMAPAPQGEPTSKELLERAGHILLYDIGFCLYVFVFLGSCGANFTSLSWTSGCPGSGSSWASISAGLMLFFAFLAVSFAILWYCGMYCDQCSRAMGPKPRPVAGRPQQTQQNHGLARVIFGRTICAPMVQTMAGVVHPTQPPPPGQPARPYAAGAPAPAAYGSPFAAAPPTAPPAPGVYGSPHVAAPAGVAPPPAAGGGRTGGAAATAGAGLAMAGQGLQALGRMVGGRAGRPSREP